MNKFPIDVFKTNVVFTLLNGNWLASLVDVVDMRASAVAVAVKRVRVPLSRASSVSVRRVWPWATD